MKEGTGVRDYVWKGRSGRRWRLGACEGGVVGGVGMARPALQVQLHPDPKQEAGGAWGS